MAQWLCMIGSLKKGKSKMNDHLKSCPFCGGEAYFNDGELYDNTPFNRISCKKCGSHTALGSEDWVEQVWNTRPSEPEPISAMVITPDQFKVELERRWEPLKISHPNFMYGIDWLREQLLKEQP